MYRKGISFLFDKVYSVAKMCLIESLKSTCLWHCILKKVIFYAVDSRILFTINDIHVVLNLRMIIIVRYSVRRMLKNRTHTSHRQDQ